MLQNRSAADDDFVIVVGSAVIVLAIWLFAGLVF